MRAVLHGDLRKAEGGIAGEGFEERGYALSVHAHRCRACNRRHHIGIVGARLVGLESGKGQFFGPLLHRRDMHHRRIAGHVVIPRTL